MENRVIVTPSVLEEVDVLTPNLRPEDVREIKTLGYSVKTELLKCFIYSNECYTVRVDDEISGMFGVTDYEQPKGFGFIWFLGSEKLNEVPREWIVLGRKYINQFLEKYDVVGGIIDQRQTAHIRWLEVMGFTFEGHLYMNRQKFKKFYKLKER